MKFGVICVSDRCSRGECEDKSGKLIQQIVLPLGETTAYTVVPDEIDLISQAIVEMSDSDKVDVVLTTGGTGFSPRDVTPEATLAVIEKQTPGISEAIRQKSLEITPMAMLSRAVSGIRKSTLIVNLPGSPKAVKESLEVILPVLPHSIETLSGKKLSCGGNY